jgi:hypothetical protein
MIGSLGASDLSGVLLPYVFATLDA